MQQLISDNEKHAPSSLALVTRTNSQTTLPSFFPAHCCSEKTHTLPITRARSGFPAKNYALENSRHLSSFQAGKYAKRIER